MALSARRLVCAAMPAISLTTSSISPVVVARPSAVGLARLLDIGLEGEAIDRSVQHHGHDHAGEPQTGNEGRRPPMAMRHAGTQPLAARASTVAPSHVG